MKAATCLKMLGEILYIHVHFNLWFLRIVLDEGLSRLRSFLASSFAQSPLLGAVFPSLSPAAPHPLVRDRTAALSPAALSVALGRTVTAVTRRDESGGLVADGAQGTDRFRLRLELESAAVGKDAGGTGAEYLDVFVKLPPERAWHIEAFLWFCGLYQTELWFYDQQSSSLRIPDDIMPKAHYVGRRGTRFMVCLQDITQPDPTCNPPGIDASSSPNTSAAGRGSGGGGAELLNLHDTCTVPRLRSVLKTLARLHAVHYGDPHAVYDEKLRSPFLNLITHLSLRSFLKRYPGVLPPDVEDTYRTFLENYATVRRRWDGHGEGGGPSRPCQTLVHGDPHSGNVYFRPDGTAGLFDWQVVSAEHPMRDVTYFLFYAASEDTLRAHERELIRYYLSCLQESLAGKVEDGAVTKTTSVPDPPPSRGVRPPLPPVPTFDEAWEEYRIQAFYPVLAAIIPAGLGDFCVDEGAVRAFTERVVAHFQRVDAAGALRDLLLLSTTGGERRRPPGDHHEKES